MRATILKKYSIKLLKIAAWIIASFLLLFIIVTILLQFSSVQTFLIQKITSQITQRVDATIDIERVALRFPKSIGLKGIYAEDQKGDTLLYVGSIFTDVKMTGLLRNKVEVNSLELSHVVANMKREGNDTVYNFQFLIDAFSGEAEAKKEEDAAKDTISNGNDKWNVWVDKVKLTHIRYHLIDHFSGIDLKVQTDELSTRLKNADLLQERYHATHIQLKAPRVKLHQNIPTFPSDPSPEPSGMPQLDIALDNISLSDLLFYYSSHDGSVIDITGESLELQPREIVLHEYLLDIKSIISKKLKADFIFPSSPDINDPEKDTIQERSPLRFDFSEIMDWHVILDQLQLSNTQFSMQTGELSGQTGFDPANLTLSNINLNIYDVNVAPQSVKLSIEQSSMDFADDFGITTLNLDMDFAETSDINNFELETLESRISLSFSSPKTLLTFSEEHLQDIPFEIALKDNNLQKDLAWLIPAMDDYYFNWPESTGIDIAGYLKGTPKDFSVDSLMVEGPGFFALRLATHIKGLPDPDSIEVAMERFTFMAAPSRIATNLPPNTLPGNITMPQIMRLSARANGSLSEFDSRIIMESDLGDFVFNAQMADSADVMQKFSGNFTTEGFDIGRLLQMTDTFGEKPGVEINFAGNGRAPRDMSLQMLAGIHNLHFNGYAYDTLDIELALKDSIASMKMDYRDDHLSIAIDGRYGAFQEIPTLTGMIKTEYAHLQKLGFTEENLLARTEINADLEFDLENFFNGHVTIDNTSIASEGEVFGLPAIEIRSQSTKENYRLELLSQLATIRYQGNFSPLLLGEELSAHFNYYYSHLDMETATLSEGDAFPDTLSATKDERRFDLDIKLRPSDIITQIMMSDIESYDTLNLQMSYSSLAQELKLDATWPGLMYGDIELDDFMAHVKSDSRQMDYTLQLRKFRSGDIALHDFTTDGVLKDQILDFNIRFNDMEAKPLYAFSGDVDFTDTLTALQLSPDHLLINGESWNVPQDNKITFGPQYIFIENFTLESQGRQLSLASRDHEHPYPIIDLGLRNIDLGRLTDFSGSEFPSLGGLFNGNATVQNIFEDPAFVANITVDDFAFMGDTLGDIIVKADNPETDFFELFASLTSEVSDVEIEGNYRTGENKGIDLLVTLQRLDLPSFEPFAAGNVTHLSGYLSGNMNITGTTEAPLIQGELQVNETSFRVPALNAGFFVKGDKILFDKQTIRLQNIALEDSAGRVASLRGNIDIADFNKVAFNLNMNSRNFQLMNVKPGQNDMYHGQILMDSDLRLRGTPNTPTVEGNIKLNEGSHFTFTLPQTTPEAIGDEGIVEFVQFGDTLFFQMAQQTADPEPLRSSFEQLDLSVNMEIDRQTEVKIIIDRYAGDFLEVRGGGVLSLGIDPGGRISLSGRYEMVEGEYLLTFYDVIRRNFRIREGSNIVWSGDPMNARVDITAIYTIRTHARELMAGQMSGDQQQNAAMRQQFPFLVYLKMRGNLEEPEISFELDLPQEHQNAMDGTLMGRINQINQDESELNKQVFALLILGSFIQDNPFATVGEGDLTATARSSASQILTQQLNRISDRYIRGVDINFEVESFVDFADGQGAGRTELQMEVSRNFFDERVRVTVGGNIELEDETRRETNAADIAGDFSIEYLLTPSGNLKVMGFRKKNYADIFDGEVIDTGISLIFSRSYNRFRDLFRREDEASAPEDTTPENEQQQK